MVTDVYVSSTYSSRGFTDTHLQADDHMSSSASNMLPTHVYESTDIIPYDEITADEAVIFIFVLLILKSIMSPLILTANSCTIIVVIKYIKMITPTHIVIAFLAIAGLFAGIVPLLNLVAYLVGDSVQAETICGVLNWAKVMSIWLNGWAIMLITVERFILVTSWKWHRKHLTSRVQAYLCFALSVCGFLVATLLSFWTKTEFSHGDCYIVKMSENKLVVHIVLIPSHVVITCSVVYCYLRIHHFIKKNRKNLVSSQNSSSESKFKKETKTTVLIAIILIAYLVGTGPASIYGLMTVKNPAIWKVEVWESFRLLWYIVVLLNNCIYVWKVPQFLEGYRKILCCVQKCRATQIVPWHNVRLRGMNLPLEPRKELENFGTTLSRLAMDIEAASCTTKESRLSNETRQEKKFGQPKVSSQNEGASCKQERKSNLTDHDCSEDENSIIGSGPHGSAKGIKNLYLEREVVVEKRNEAECSSEVEVSTIYLED